MRLTPSGLRVKVHVPEFGKPFNTILPFGIVQSGCAMMPTVGAFVVQASILTIIFRLFKVKSGALGFVTRQT